MWIGRLGAAVAASADLREVVVGVIGRAHGVRGEVTIAVRTDEPERRFAPGQVIRAERGVQTFTVKSARDHSGRLLVAFEELPNRTAAEAVRGIVLVVDVPSDERPADESEYYDRDLIGLEVRSADGAKVGVIAGVAHLPAQDVLEIDTHATLRLVPFVDALVPEVNLAAGYVRLANVGGLLEDLPD